jgi:hypothetical protein
MTGGLGSSLLLYAALVILGLLFAWGLFFGIFIVVVVANRAEPDATGRRPSAVYCFAASYISLLLGIFGSFVVVVALVGLLGTTHSSYPSLGSITGSSQLPPGMAALLRGPIHPVGDAAARLAVLGGLILLVADASFVFHRRRGLALVQQGGAVNDPVTRVALSYTSAVAFFSVLLLIASLVVTGYSIFRVVAPGVFNYGGNATAAVHVLLDAGYLVILAGLILVRDLRLGSKLRASAASAASAPPPPSAPPAPLA